MPSITPSSQVRRASLVKILMTQYKATEIRNILEKEYGITTAEWFRIFGHDYIITERKILRKVTSGTLIIIIILSIIMIIYSIYDINKQNSNELRLIDLVLLGVFFNLMVIVAFSFVKTQDQDSKKDFRLFFASGYCKKAIQVDDELKTEYMRESLKSYNAFLQRSHNYIIKNIEKINVRILSNRSDTNNIINQLSQSFESGDSYAPLDKMAGLMNITRKEDLLRDNSIFQKIRYWSVLISPLIGAITSFVLMLIFRLV